MRIRIAHSPDSDDAFMFCALSTGAVGVPGFPDVQVEHVLADIETLNRAAVRGTYEVSAVSIHAYAHLHRRYRLMPCGASMGEGYGPIVVAAHPLRDLAGRRVALPGAWTSAALAARLYAPDLVPVWMPFDEVGPAVLAGDVEAGVIIHEGQLTWRDDGLVKLADLGVWWAEAQGGLPLPLGGNVVRRDLDPALALALTRATRDSIVWALEHRDEALSFAMKHARGLDRGKADRFVGMYVNPRTVDYGPDGRLALRRLLDLAHAEGLVPGPVPLDLVALDEVGDGAREEAA